MQASFMCERVCEPPGPFDKDSTVAHYIHLRLNPHQKVRFNCSSLYSSTIESSSKDPESSLPLFDLRLCILVVAFSQIINQFLTPSREQHTLPLTTTTSMPPGLLHSSPPMQSNAHLRRPMHHRRLLSPVPHPSISVVYELHFGILMVGAIIYILNSCLDAAMASVLLQHS
jgi:hypothetical protein